MSAMIRGLVLSIFYCGEYPNSPTSSAQNLGGLQSITIGRAMTDRADISERLILESVEQM